MNKFKTQKSLIVSLKKDHQKMISVLQVLNPRQKKTLVIGKWTPREVVAHLAGWNLEYIKEIDAILKNKPTWYKKFSKGRKATDRENDVFIAERKNLSFAQTVSEWKKTFLSLVARLEKLSKEEWNHESTKGDWFGEGPITIEKIFRYTYKDIGHEAGHAKQIKKFFDTNL
jgi:hypothetical protein